MPVATIYIYGSLPVQIEFNAMWEPLEASVNTAHGVVYLDVTDAELFQFCDANTQTIQEQLRSQRKTKADARSSYREDEMKEERTW